MNNRFQDVMIREGETMIDKNDKNLERFEEWWFFPHIYLGEVFFFEKEKEIYFTRKNPNELHGSVSFSI